MPSLFQLRAFITWWLDAVDGHSLHSPFLFDFYNNIIAATKQGQPNEPIEALRRLLLGNNAIVEVEDLGAGSAHNAGAKRRISDIARTSLSSARFSRIYQRLIRHYACKTALELGTSLGVNTLYLADGASHVTTFEGAPAIAQIARENFRILNRHNIDVITGDIESTLPEFLNGAGKVDFVYVDANHRYEPTIRYFDWLKPHLHNRSVVVLDDIHYHSEMEAAWNTIRDDSGVIVSIDLFRAGILFFDPSLNKQHVVIQV
ncbi:MAG TPA: class I SAM-dependent methyltransferase [Ohtaekwangia sp.]|nr:class I SAM-dependent methyltransferase [Ohtaekwangia sp.]